jgi:hypothetical protein
MLVSVNSASLQGNFVLKVYDRRYATGLREQLEMSLWWRRTESAYLKFVREGNAKRVFDECDAAYKEDEFFCGDNSWNNAQCEAYLQYLCIQSYETETRAYDKMLDMQGKYVPRLFARGWLQRNLEPGLANEFVGCPWILLEHVQGFPLTDLSEHAPRTDWQYICETAIQIILMIGDRGICNGDVNTRSFIIAQEKETGQYRVVMMDFGICWFRDQVKDEEDFNFRQAHADEEGAIGHIMAKKLKGGFVYRRSERALNLTERFMREDCA